jgi:hypothetical protein
MPLCAMRVGSRGRGHTRGALAPRCLLHILSMTSHKVPLVVRAPEPLRVARVRPMGWFIFRSFSFTCFSDKTEGLSGVTVFLAGRTMVLYELLTG